MNLTHESLYTMIHHVWKLAIRFVKDIFHCSANVDQKVYIGLISESKYIATPSMDMVTEYSSILCVIPYLVSVYETEHTPFDCERKHTL